MPDHVEAAKWMRKAADQGDSTAQESLGLMYHRGDGVLLRNQTGAQALIVQSNYDNDSFNQVTGHCGTQNAPRPLRSTRASARNWLSCKISSSSREQTRPAAIRSRPSTITVCAPPRELNTRFAMGLMTGAQSAEIMLNSVMSAFLPASSEPISLARPRAAAARIVAISNAVSGVPVGASRMTLSGHRPAFYVALAKRS